MNTKLMTFVIFVSLAGSAHAAKIGGDVTQVLEADNVINTAAGYEVYSRQDINTIYDNVDVGGSVTQRTHADNIINTGAGYKVTACQSINVIGQTTCKRQ
ncbi:MAG: hypothetical protein KDJ99_25385 [Candidatus Competibacteraceae bacterium]|nr:hypothetical protein [Candidatus Competibacteraceae bacterium]